MPYNSTIVHVKNLESFAEQNFATFVVLKRAAKGFQWKMIATLIIIIIVITITLLANALLKYSHKYFKELKPQTGTNPEINQGGWLDNFSG